MALSKDQVDVYGDLAAQLLQLGMTAKQANDAAKAQKAKDAQELLLAKNKAAADIALAQQAERDSLAANIAQINKAGVSSLSGKPSGGSSLGTGAIIGISLGSLALVGAIVFIIYKKTHK